MFKLYFFSVFIHFDNVNEFDRVKYIKYLIFLEFSNQSHFLNLNDFSLVLINICVFCIPDNSFWLVRACDLDQAQNGCRIDNGACSCSYGCKSEYRYANLKECLDALKVIFGTIFATVKWNNHRNNVFFLFFRFISWQFQKGRSNDLCSRGPCLHRGVCIQITQTPGYRCRCEGTGYFGNRCQRKCPNAEESLMIGQFPYECIVIWCICFLIDLHKYFIKLLFDLLEIKCARFNNNNKNNSNDNNV